MKQKRLMLLGGIRYLLPVIKAAHEQGYFVITADYLPDNIAHKYSDKYVNVSIVDKEAVLKVAQEEQIDGILSFGVDPGVVTASYVQNELGLPSFGPYASVEILQNKDLFRDFMEKNGFNVPEHYSFSSVESVLAQKDRFKYPVIVKPTDSAGSKGVARVDTPSELAVALHDAFEYSIKGNVIVEQFIEKRGCSSDTDSFSVDGVFKILTFSAQRFDAAAANPYTPASYSWPSTFMVEEERQLESELQRLISLLGMKTCIYNIETRVGVDGKPYIMEVSPRGGGNRLAEVVRMATGVDMITASVRSAVGDPIQELIQRPYDGVWSEIILHSDKIGVFEDIWVESDYEKYIVEKDLWVKKGDSVRSFKGANDAIGTMIMNFADMEMMEKALADLKWLKVVVK